MSTTQRKDRRNKKTLEIGRNAEQLIAAAQESQAISDRALAKALDELEDLRSLPVELRDIWGQLHRSELEREEALDQVADLLAQLALGTDAIEACNELISTLKTERDEVVAADKDAAKLRRRLVEAKNKVRELQLQISRESRAAIF